MQPSYWALEDGPAGSGASSHADPSLGLIPTSCGLPRSLYIMGVHCGPLHGTCLGAHWQAFFQVPFYRGERITFDVAPSQLDFMVEHDSLKIEVRR